MKRFFKSFISLLVVFATLSITSEFASASEIVPTDDYYMVRGQVDLTSIADDLYIENGNVKIRGVTSQSANFLKSELSHRPNLNKILSQMISEGLTPDGIAYTIVELKEVTDADGFSHLEPMTVGDVQLLGSGDKVSKGNLRLYVAAARTGKANEFRSVTTAEWTTDLQLSASNRPADGDDLMTITAPKNFQYATSYFTSQTSGFYESIPSSNYHLADIKYSSAVFAFKEFVSGQYSLKSAGAWLVSTGSLTSNNNLFIGKYCHTWTTTVPSFTISASGGVSFSAEQNSWNIACSYHLPA